MKLHSACLKKRYYRTYEFAEKIARRCMAARPETKLRVYFCSLCGNFHLTSQPETAHAS